MVAGVYDENDNLVLDWEDFLNVYHFKEIDEKRLFRKDNSVNLSCFKLVISDKISTISDKAFIDTKINNIYFPESVKLIDSYAFKNADVKNVTFKTEKLFLNTACFRNSGIEKIDIKHLTYLNLATGVFEDCKDLRTVKLPDCLQAIKSRTFKNCTSLKNIHWSGGAIGLEAFEDCESLTDINFAITAAFTDAFKNCNFKKINLPELSEIKSGAFEKCSLKRVKISCTKLLDNAFLDCKDLRYIVFNNVNEVYESFTGCDKLKEFFILGNTKVLFKNKDFKNLKTIYVEKNRSYYQEVFEDKGYNIIPLDFDDLANMILTLNEISDILKETNHKLDFS